MNIGQTATSWRGAQRHSGRRALLLLGAFVAAWALVEGVIGARLQLHYDLTQVVWCRYAAHLGFIFLLWGRHQPSRLWRTRRPGFQLARSMLMLVMPASFALSLQAGDHADTVWALFWMSPFMIIVLARVWLAERVPLWMWVLAVLGDAVAAMMIGPPLPHSFGGLVLPLVMAMSFSLYVVMTRSLRDESVRTNLFYTAAGVFSVLSFWVPHVWVTPNWHDAVLLAAIGIVGFLALLAMDRACESAPVSWVAPVLFMHPVCMTLIEWLIGGEPVSRRAAAGVVFISVVLLGLWAWQPSLAERARSAAPDSRFRF